MFLAFTIILYHILTRLIFQCSVVVVFVAATTRVLLLAFASKM